MRFVDEAMIKVRAGKGGHGCISFRREKFIPKGGPNGGDGGKGGDVYLRASESLLTLYDFQLKRNYQAENGRPGQGKDKHGRSGRDLIIDLPLGTIIKEKVEDSGGNFVADLACPGQMVKIASGGRGGRGNIHFKSSTRRTPRIAEEGEKGQEKTIHLELKLLADVGLIGLPNAGKSTFISAVSAARPKIATYPFTTLRPHLGVVQDEMNNRMVLADIPGLIEGAHQGQGLGDTFLKHIARTKVLVHFLSVEDISLSDNLRTGFEIVNNELAKFDSKLAEKEQILVINKFDLLSPEERSTLKDKLVNQDRKIYCISALYQEGIEDLLQSIWSRVLNR